jgi:hypothetical protein
MSKPSWMMTLYPFWERIKKRLLLSVPDVEYRIAVSTSLRHRLFVVLHSDIV